MADGGGDSPVAAAGAAGVGARTARRGWLNRTVLGMGLTSLFADMNYEMSTAILPGFLATLGLPAAVLGVTEGIADAVSSFSKLGAGWLSDGLRRRKPLVLLGYGLTVVSQAFFAIASGWPLIVLGRVVGWLGRGIRRPARDAMLAESIAAADRGKAFGFHRAGDSLGAVLGPLIGAGVIALLGRGFGADDTAAFRVLFLLSLVPGFAAVLAFGFMVGEVPGRPIVRRHLIESVRKFPIPFRRYLAGVGVFGAGDFAHALLVLVAAQLLSAAHGVVAAAQIAAVIYALRNAVHTAASFPVGALSDRIGRRGLLAGGYLLGAGTMVGFALTAATGAASVPLLAVLFALAGAYIAVEEALEAALTADLVPDRTNRGTAYGVLGTVNGVGDLVSSSVVGALWAIGPAWGFVYAAATMTAGAAVSHLRR
ncbi:MAG: MFS transporter [Actinobacteria bacterium]|nr:MFS transporter [Actinomycetota bacterium]